MATKLTAAEEVFDRTHPPCSGTVRLDPPSPGPTPHVTAACGTEDAGPCPPAMAQLDRSELDEFFLGCARSPRERFVGYANARGVCTEDAEDAFSEALTTLLTLFRAGQATRGMIQDQWLFRVAMRRAVDNYRRGRRLPVEPGCDPEPPLPKPCETRRQESRQDMLAAMRECLGRMPDDERELLEFYYWEGLTQTAIGLPLGIDQGSISARLTRAEKRLAEAVRKELMGQGYADDQLPPIPSKKAKRRAYNRVARR